MDDALRASWFSTGLLTGELLGGGEESCGCVGVAGGGCEAAGVGEVVASNWAMASMGLHWQLAS